QTAPAMTSQTLPLVVADFCSTSAKGAIANVSAQPALLTCFLFCPMAWSVRHHTIVVYRCHIDDTIKCLFLNPSLLAYIADNPPPRSIEYVQTYLNDVSTAHR